eukprot:Skav226824  [mRNA]  locus=scaffold606:199332:204567:+ [translate_table: standard]
MKAIALLLVLSLLVVLTDASKARVLALFRVADAWWGNPRRRRSRRRAVVCNDVVKEVKEDVWKCSPAKTRTVWKDITKWHKVKKNVTKWTNATRNETRNKTVNYTLPPEDFVIPAKEKLVQEMMESFNMTNQSANEKHFDNLGQTNSTFDSFDGDSADDVALVAFGPTRTGKSSVICQARRKPGDDCPRVGNSRGESTTTEVSPWDSIFGFILDTMGLGDSFLRFSKEEIGKRVTAGIGSVASTNLKAVKFLVFAPRWQLCSSSYESMASDALQLRDTLLHLLTFFGEEARKGIVVIATKPNMNSPEDVMARYESIKEAMREQGLGPRQLVVWHPPEGDPKRLDQVDAGSVEELRAALKSAAWQREHIALDGSCVLSCQAQVIKRPTIKRISRGVSSVAVSELDDFWTRVSREAKRMTKNISVEIEEEYWIPYDVEETKGNVQIEENEEKYTEPTPFEEIYEAEQSESHGVVYIHCGAGISRAPTATASRVAAIAQRWKSGTPPENPRGIVGAGSDNENRGKPWLPHVEVRASCGRGHPSDPRSAALHSAQPGLCEAAEANDRPWMVGFRDG